MRAATSLLLAALALLAQAQSSASPANAAETTGSTVPPAQTTAAAPTTSVASPVSPTSPTSPAATSPFPTSPVEGTTAAPVTTAQQPAGANPVTTTQQQQQQQPTTTAAAAAQTTPVVAQPIVPSTSNNVVVVVVSTQGRTLTVTGSDPSAVSSAAVASLAAVNDGASTSGGGVAGWVIAVAVVGGLAGAALLGFLLWFCTRRRFAGLNDEDRDQPIRWPELKSAPGDTDGFGPAAAARPVTDMDLGSEFGEESHASYLQGPYSDDPRQSYYDPYVGGAPLPAGASRASMGYPPTSPTQPAMSEYSHAGRPLSSYSAFSGSGSGHAHAAPPPMTRPGSGLSMYSQGGATVWPPNQRASMASSVSPPAGVDLSRGASVGSTYAGSVGLDRGASVRSVGDMRGMHDQRGPLHVANFDDDVDERLA